MLDGVEQVLHIAKAAPLISILFIAIMLALFGMLCFVMFRVPLDPLPGSTQPRVADFLTAILQNDGVRELGSQ